MFLVIDNTPAEQIVLYYDVVVGVWHEERFIESGEGGLLMAIEKLFKKIDQPLTALTGLAVRVGHGRFTSTRVATTVANTLGYALQIPVIAATDIDLDVVADRLRETPVGQYATALYSAEASVGKK